jgi:hypothetical protein
MDWSQLTQCLQIRQPANPRQHPLREAAGPAEWRDTLATRRRDSREVIADWRRGLTLANGSAASLHFPKPVSPSR